MESAVNRYRFYKTEYGSWYIDLPNWEGSIGELQMVAGADTLLDSLSDNKSDLYVDISTTSEPGFAKLSLIQKKPFGGADYKLDHYNKEYINHEMWLCDVTSFVFNSFPEEIYFKVVE